MVMLQPSSSVASIVPTTFASDDSKYAVADILTSFASGEPVTPTTLSGIFSTATSSTDLLTPTTLANLEQTLIDFQAGTAASNLPRESGFIPPVINPGPSTTSTMVKQEYSDYMYEDDSSQDMDSDWYSPNSKQPRYDSDAMIQPYNGVVPTTTTHRRRRLDDNNLTPDEADRRNVRRERNKVAAAKCRQRRVDLTNKLLVESEGLEEEQSKLENEIQMLAQQKEQLEFLLEAHQPICSAKVSQAQSTSIKTEKLNISYPSVFTVSAPTSSVGTSTYQVTDSQASTSISYSSTSRPNTLPIPAKPLNLAMCSVTQATGVPITTPSSVFNFGLESMMDGHTGLTPITGTPSCASQIQRHSTDGSSSSDGLASPTTLLAL